MRAIELAVAAAFAATTIPNAYAAEEITVQLVAREGKFFPPELIVPAGRKIRIEIRNDGKDPVEFESMELRKEKVLAPGAQSSVVIQPLTPGEYKFFDEFHMNTAQGVIVAK